MSEPSWEQNIVKAIEGVPLVPVVLFVVGSLTFLLHRRMNELSSKDDDWAKTLKGTKVKNGGQSSTVPSTRLLKNIWEERQKNGSAALERTQKSDDDGKPFGSSYYYAHNSLRRTGGYKDGLRMEDYQMETPRLLSKGGVDLRDQGPGSTTTEHVSKLSEAAKPSEKRVIAPECIPITKYLWDDPGDHKAIGTLRIDQLADNLSWKEADVSDIQIDLKNESSLSVLITTDDKVYRLYIPQFYGKVEEVKKVAKSQRLLVRLYKRKKDSVTGEIDEKNIKAWPTPYKKAI